MADRPIPEAINDPVVREQLAELFDKANQPHPFLHPDSLAAWFGAEENSTARLLTVCCDNKIRCAGVLDSWTLPVFELPGPLPIKIRRQVTRLFGKGLLCVEGDSASATWFEALRTFNDRCHSNGTLFEALDRNDPFAQDVLGEHTNLRAFDPNTPQPHWRVQLPDSIDEYWSQNFSGKTRSTLRRKRRKLGEYTIEVATTPEEVEAFLMRASEVSEHTWQTKLLGLRVKNNQQEQALYRSLAERDAFRGYLLNLDGKAIAFVICTVRDSYVRYEETGFLPEFSGKSPGTVLVSELIDDLISDGRYRCLDFGLGHADYKQLFANEQSESEDAWLLSNTIQSAVDVGLINAQERVRGAVKSVLDKTGLMRRIRRWKKNQ